MPEKISSRVLCGVNLVYKSYAKVGVCVSRKKVQEMRYAEDARDICVRVCEEDEPVMKKENQQISLVRLVPRIERKTHPSK